MITCHCLCTASHDPTPGPMRACVNPVGAVVTVRTDGTMAAQLGPTREIPMCLDCAGAWEAIGPRFVGRRNVGDPNRAPFN